MFEAIVMTLVKAIFIIACPITAAACAFSFIGGK